VHKAAEADKTAIRHIEALKELQHALTIGSTFVRVPAPSERLHFVFLNPHCHGLCALLWAVNGSMSVKSRKRCLRDST
jgi:hypothetical protein